MTSVEKFEKSRLELQERLDAAKSRIERNRLGQFATPPLLATDVVAHALGLLPTKCAIRFLEPGFGTGSFYSALRSQAPARRIRSAAGFEIDSHYARPAKRLWRSTGLQLHLRDFATTTPPRSESSKFNLVVCNPPYVRHHHLSKAYKHLLQAALARYANVELNGLSGLYAYLMILSRPWMSKDGLGVWLVPSEFMDVNYGRKVKKFLTDDVTLLRIHRFDPNEVQFDDALVSSAIVFFKNTPPRSGQRASFTFGGTLSKPRMSELLDVDTLPKITKWTSLPRSRQEMKPTLNGFRLSDLFTIKRGVATGCNAFFIVSAERIEQLYLPRQFLQPILPGPKEILTDEILADKSGEPAIANRRYLLACTVRENEVRLKYPTLWNYFEHGRAEGLDQRYLAQHRSPWYSQEHRPAAPFLCTYMGRQTVRAHSPFRFIINHSLATAANVYLLLYPKPPLARFIGNDLGRRRAAGLALSAIAATELTREGRVYGGGLYKLEPNELGHVFAGELINLLSVKTNVDFERQLILPGV